MPKRVFVLLIGSMDRAEGNRFQLLQEESAVAEGRRTGIEVEVEYAPGFDQFRALRKRLSDPDKPVDAVITEPASTNSMELVLKELKGKMGLVLLNTGGPVVEQYIAQWGHAFPIGTVSTPHTLIGEIQGRQVTKLLPQGGRVLVITGPQRSSAAQQRLAGLKATLAPGITAYDSEGGQWTEADGILAFNSWYGVHKTRQEAIGVIAGHNDELAMGARSASRAVSNASHREAFLKTRFLGVDACRGYGKDLVDKGTLHASIVTPPNTGVAIALLQKFWVEGKPLAPQAYTEVTPYPPTTADR